MEAKISKAQLEVWEWRESLHEELKNIPETERLNYIHEKVKSSVDRLKKKTESMSNS